MKPTISIIMPLYNADCTVEAAIRSILQQTFSDWELLIFDDGSSDDSINMVRSFSDERIKCYPESINRGISYRLNQGIRIARGRYIARMDSDDIAFPERLERQFDFMEQNPDVDLCATKILIFSDQPKFSGLTPISQSHEEICSRPWNGFYMAHPTWFGRVEWFRANLYHSFADKAEDQDLLYRTYQRSKFACLPDVLLGYRQNGRSFQKMLTARKAFRRAFCDTAVKRGDWKQWIVICCNQTMKMVADFLCIKAGFSGLRNRMESPDPELQEYWCHILENCSCRARV